MGYVLWAWWYLIGLAKGLFWAMTMGIVSLIYKRLVSFMNSEQSRHKIPRHAHHNPHLGSMTSLILKFVGPNISSWNLYKFPWNLSNFPEICTNFREIWQISGKVVQISGFFTNFRMTFFWVLSALWLIYKFQDETCDGFPALVCVNVSPLTFPDAFVVFYLISCPISCSACHQWTILLGHDHEDLNGM